MRWALRIALWGLGYSPEDPDRGLSFGLVQSPVGFPTTRARWRWTARSPSNRCKLEAYMGARRYQAPALAGARAARAGAAGRRFLAGAQGRRGQARATLAGRYPESAWGQLNLNYGVPRVLGRGKNGAVPTVRSEAFREAQQELEARVFVEKALLDAAGPELLART